MRSCLFLLLILVLPLSSAQSGDLSPHIRPVSYDLLIDTNFNNWRYDGKVSIVIDVSKDATDEIKLHAKDGVKITKMELKNLKGGVIQKLTVGKRQNLSKDLLVFSLDKPLSRGKYLIQSEFWGTVSPALTGYYRTGYKMAETGKFVQMASTHLSPDKARTVFPCFDEPQFRATFSLTLVHPSSLTAISNMPVVGKPRKIKEGRTMTVFEKSPGMSTYLLAWVQHNFVYGESSIGKVRLRHYVRPSHPDAIPERLMIIGKSIDYFNNFFDIPYPLPKLDTIGIPNYPVGGMENWGLITLSERRGLELPNERYGTDEVGYRNLLAHEVSHMWFGNLVTMYWWNDLWLKEGMASYISYPCVGAIYKDVNMDDFLMLDNWQEGMMVDDTVTSHPVRMEVKSTRQITQIFDKITYSKGAAVLYMLREVMGEAKFKEGMTHFLNTFKFSVADYKGLMSSFVKFTDQPKTVSHFMDSFILQKNFPLVTIEVLSRNKIKLTQSRYVRQSGMKVKDDSSPFGYSWFIPINIIADTFSVTEHIWLKGKSLVITLPAKFTWLKLNIEGRQLYVTHYPSKMRDALVAQLSASLSGGAGKVLLSPRERAHVLADLYQSAQLGLTPYSRVLDATNLLQREQHFLPWRVTYYMLKRLRSFLSPSMHACLRSYVVLLLRPQWGRVRQNARRNLSDEIMFETFFIYNRHFKKAPAPVRIDDQALASLLEHYKSASKVDRADIDLLMDTHDEKQIEMIGNTIQSHPSSEPEQMLNFIHQYNDVAPKALWRVYKRHYSKYNEAFGLTQFSYASTLKALTENQSDPATIAEIEKFFAEHSAGSGELGLRNGLEVALFRVQFRKHSEPAIRDYLREKNHCT